MSLILLSGNCPGSSLSHVSHKLSDGGEDGIGLVAMSRMAAILEAQDFDRSAYLACDCIDLGHGSVLIFESLDEKDRAGDPRKVFFDIPVAKIGMKPDVVPSPEGASRVAMVTREFFAEVGSFEFVFGFGNTLDAEIFDENMRGEKDESAKTVVNSSIDERDGSAVAVADQNWRFDVEPREEFR